MKNLWLTCFFASLSYSLFAQTDSTAIELDAVNVSVNRFEENRLQQASQIQQISQKVIEFQNTSTSADLLINTGNIFVQKSQSGGGSPVIRGFEANRVLLVVDGIRMNNAIYRSGHLQNVLRIDQTVLENVEIIFGPSSLIYGSDALGGTISFKTKDPKLNTRSAHAFVRYGSAMNEKTGHVNFNLGGTKWASFTGITASDFGNIRQGNWRSSQYPDFGKRFNYQGLDDNGNDIAITNPDVNVQRESGYRQLDLIQKISFVPTNRVRHTLNIQYSGSSNVPRYDRLSEIKNGNLRFAEWYYGPEKRLLAAYELRLRGGTWYDDASVKLAHQAIKESRNSRRWESPSFFSQVENVAVNSLNADFIKHHEDNTYQYGVEFVGNWVKSSATETNRITDITQKAATRYPDGGSTMFSTAAYLSSRNAFADNHLFINYGVRYSYVNLSANFIDKTFFPFDYDQVTQNVGALVGNAGITWNPKRNTKYAVLFSNGFRVPNVDDLGKVFDSVPGQVVVPNPGIRPETSYNFEASTEQSFGRVVMGITAYYIIFDNIIVLRKFSIDGKQTIDYQGVSSEIYANQNADHAYIVGANAQLKAALATHWQAQFTLNVLKGRLRDANKTPLDHIPPTHGRAAVTYQKDGLQLEAFSLFNGAKKLSDYSPSGEDNLQYATADGMPAWWTLNFRSSFQLSKQLTAQLAIENILDKNYRYFASGISAAGRNIIATLRLSL